MTGVAFSPDGRTLASGGVDGTAILWNVSPRQPIEDSRTQRTPAFSVAFSPDGKTLAASGLPITLTDVATGRTSAQLLDRGLVAPVISVAFSPDGKTLAAATEGTSARGPGPPSRPGPGGPPQGPPGSSIVLWDVGTQRPAGRPIALPRAR